MIVFFYFMKLNLSKFYCDNAVLTQHHSKKVSKLEKKITPFLIFNNTN